MISIRCHVFSQKSHFRSILIHFNGHLKPDRNGVVDHVKAPKGMLNLKISSIISLFMKSKVITLRRYFRPHRPTDSINIFRKRFLFSWKSNKI